MDWELNLPMPLLLVIDDVGWWSGEDGSARGEPFRTGIGRAHVPADYQAVVELGRRLGMRLLAAFVAGEWDRHNRLAALPSSNPRGEGWDNRHRVGPWLDEAADILRRGRDHVELAVHGLNHEHWHRGRMSRAEFHTLDGEMRPRELVVRHLEAFAEILEDNGLGPFPRCFVPPALLHGLGNGERGIQGILRRRGIRFVNTHFASLPRPPGAGRPFAVECGVMLVDRREPFVPWNALAPAPRFAFDQPVLSLHWPNVLHADPARNLEVVEGWAAYLRPFDDRFDGMLAADAGSCWSQVAHRHLARVERIPRGFRIDTAAVRTLGIPDLDRFTVKVRAPGAARWRVEGGTLEASGHDARSGVHTLRLRSAEARASLRLTAAPRSQRFPEAA